MKDKIVLYDTTLRDGAQREGLNLSLEDKIKIAKKLDGFGIHYIEGGFPASNPKDRDFFAYFKNNPLNDAKLAAFGSTRRKNTEAGQDANLNALLEAETSVVTIVGKTWDLHIQDVLKTSLEENLKMIRDSVLFLKKHEKEVVFDAEHFFDGYKKNSKYTTEALNVALEAGADWLVLCDTNGGTLPFEISRIVEKLSKGIKADIGIHAHNDAECAVANSIVAVNSGCRMVQGTVNGYGERCGNANMSSIIPALQLKLGYKVISNENMSRLTSVSHYVSEVANVIPDSHQPYVGHSAFAHKGGLHIDAVKKNPQTFEHIMPELVGNLQRIVVSELSGKSTIVLKAKDIGVDLEDSPVKISQIIEKIKDLEHAGYYFDAADGSFEIILRKETGLFKELFKLESFRVIMEKREDGKVTTEATIKLEVNDERVIATAEGNGPVNALDNAFRKAAGKSFPHLNDIVLTDYKVRVLDEKKGTAAVTRVLIETSDGQKSWGTIGVSENIIEASWQALVDSMNYGLMHASKNN